MTPGVLWRKNTRELYNSANTCSRARPVVVSLPFAFYSIPCTFIALFLYYIYFIRRNSQSAADTDHSLFFRNIQISLAGQVSIPGFHMYVPTCAAFLLIPFDEFEDTLGQNHHMVLQQHYLTMRTTRYISLLVRAKVLCSWHDGSLLLTRWSAHPSWWEPDQSQWRILEDRTTTLHSETTSFIQHGKICKKKPQTNPGSCSSGEEWALD